MNKDEQVCAVSQSRLRDEESGPAEAQYSSTADISHDGSLPCPAPSSTPYVFACHQKSVRRSVTSFSTSSSCFKSFRVPERAMTASNDDVLASRASTKPVEPYVAADQRLHPRRTSGITALRQPPKLQRQEERKTAFVDSLVDSATDMVEAIWPLSTSPRCKASGASKGVLPLRTFIQETLKRSGTSYSTLQVALYYLILVRPHVPSHDFTMQQPRDEQALRALQCGRRMFLAALILASKYLQDRTYSANAWSKISGLKVAEVNLNEMTFLSTVKWKLHIPAPTFEKWTDIVLTTSSPQPPGPPAGLTRNECWKSIVRRLTPELDIKPGEVSSAMAMACHLSRVSRMLRPCSDSELEAQPLRINTSEEVTAFPQRPPLLTRGSEIDLAPLTFAQRNALPTPQLTPEPLMSSTPAVGAIIFKQPCRPVSAAILSSMATKQCSARFRSCEVLSHPMGSRSPFSRSTSSESSPESMISDNTSYRTSRSSSFSSVSSTLALPGADLTKLVRLVTCTDHLNFEPDVVLPGGESIQSGLEEASNLTSKFGLRNLCASPTASIDSSFVLPNSETLRAEKCERSGRMGPPKRTHSQRHSMDLDCLQDNVRDFLNCPDGKLNPTWRDPLGAKSFVLRPLATEESAPLNKTSRTWSPNNAAEDLESAAVVLYDTSDWPSSSRPSPIVSAKRRCCTHSTVGYNLLECRASLAGV